MPALLALRKEIKKVKFKGHVLWAVPFKPDHVRVLNNAGYSVPAPAEVTYKYPGMSPFAHQRKTTGFLTLNPRAMVLSGMGTGKTASTLWACDWLRQHGLAKKILIVAPLSCLRKTWVEEIDKLLPFASVSVLHGRNKAAKLKALKAGATYNIINHDGVKHLLTELRNEEYDTIIVDESSAFRNHKTARWKAIKLLADKADRVWALTGTPTPTAPTDAWAQAKFVGLSNAPRIFKMFQEETMRPIPMRAFTKWVPKPDAQVKVHKLLQPAIRFTKEQCLDLPPVTYVRREVGISTEQKQAVEELKKEFYTRTQSGEEITAANAAVRISKVLQVLQGSVKNDIEEHVPLDASPRLKELDTILGEVRAGETSAKGKPKKLIVFASFRGALDVVSRHLTASSVSFARVDGSVSETKRSQIFSDFQHTECYEVLLCHYRVASHGLTLTAANTIVWWGPTYEAEYFLQANARIHRLGQDTPATVVMLGGHAAEWGAYDVVQGRVDRQQTLLDMYKALIN